MKSLKDNLKDKIGLGYQGRFYLDLWDKTDIRFRPLISLSLAYNALAGTLRTCLKEEL